MGRTATTERSNETENRINDMLFRFNCLNVYILNGVIVNCSFQLRLGAPACVRVSVSVSVRMPVAVSSLYCMYTLYRCVCARPYVRHSRFQQQSNITLTVSHLLNSIFREYDISQGKICLDVRKYRYRYLYTYIYMRRLSAWLLLFPIG